MEATRLLKPLVQRVTRRLGDRAGRKHAFTLSPKKNRIHRVRFPLDCFNTKLSVELQLTPVCSLLGSASPFKGSRGTGAAEVRRVATYPT